jgi:lipopolysaccharide biosynthesis glycosyltransferase
MSKTAILVECRDPACIPPFPEFVRFEETGKWLEYPPFFSMVRWAVDHVDADRIGFFRQHEYLDFSDGTKPARESFLSENTCKAHGLDDLSARLAEVELAMARPVSLRRTTVRQYGQEQGICPCSVTDAVLGLAKTMASPYADSVSSYFLGSSYRPRVLPVFSCARFDRYCAFLFPLLDSIVRRFPTLSVAGLSFLADGLTSAFFLEAGTAAVELPVVTFVHASDPPSLAPAFDTAVPVVFASNERFAPSLGVCLSSLLEHASTERNYDIVVLSSDLSGDSCHRLSLTAGGRDNVSLRFFDPRGLLEGKALQKNPTDHISEETYYRFLISSILPGYRKVLYLDCDTVVNADVARLFDTDLHGHAVGATVEPEVSGLRAKDATLRSYLEKVLGLGEDDPYFQAGVLVLDLQALQRIHPTEEWLRIAGSRKFRYNDQDIINKECKGRIAELDQGWNVVTDCARRRIPLIAQGPHRISRAYLLARKDPLLVHYAGFEKPWDEPTSDFAYLFWEYARRSAFYDRLLTKVADGAGNGPAGLRERLFPRGSKRRSFAKRLYLRFSGLERN